jgi:cytochrome c biogenesis protein CcmG/thiol:disulfide interchange protein DsbE
MMRSLLIVSVFVVLVAAAGIGLTKRLVGTAHEGAPVAAAAITPGAGVTIELSDRPIDLPALAEHLTDLEGRTLTLEDYKDKVVLLNFWATWCGPCREEIPALAALQSHYRNQVVIVGLSIDERPAEDVRTFAKTLGVNYPVVMAGDDLQKAFGGITSVPSTFVVNREGRVVQRHIGTLDPQHTEHEIRALAGLPTDAKVETVKDTGQVLLANAAYATEIPGVDLSGMTPDQKAEALHRLNTEQCTCGCNTTLAQCRINDPTCQTSLPIARKVAEAVRKNR